MATAKTYIIGIGYKPLEKKAIEIIYNSKIILASNRLFEVFKGYDEFEAVKDKVKVINNIDETIEFIKAIAEDTPPYSPPYQGGEWGGIPLDKGGIRGVVLLASGDPMFFGIGRRAVKELGKDNAEILPDLSSVQIAFSRIKEPWDDAFLISLHGGPDPEKRRRLPYEITDIPALLQRYNKIAILTDKENNPAEIAKILNLSPIANINPPSPPFRKGGMGGFRIFVCERLGYPDEKITEGTPEEIAGMTFSEPNVVIIQNTEDRTQNTDNPPSPPFNKGGMGGFFTFGLKESEISHSHGLITKDEVRAITLHKLRLPEKGVFWDIGAGSGSVSIEAARLFRELRVFAIEKDRDQISNIKENILTFSIPNIKCVAGEAPEALKELPVPDRVFIGGSSGRLRKIIDYVIKKHVKLIIVNAATIETLNDAIQCFEKHGFNIEISEISVSRAKVIAGKRHMSALNPVFIITGEK